MTKGGSCIFAAACVVGTNRRPPQIIINHFCDRRWSCFSGKVRAFWSVLSSAMPRRKEKHERLVPSRLVLVERPPSSSPATPCPSKRWPTGRAPGCRAGGPSNSVSQRGHRRPHPRPSFRRSSARAKGSRRTGPRPINTEAYATEEMLLLIDSLLLFQWAGRHKDGLPLIRAVVRTAARRAYFVRS
jgi:hypothetical protein